jgi:hypothetical protein
MSVTINVNGLSLAHKGSDGIAVATLPDICKTPSPSGGTPVPVPYPNIAVSADLSKGTTTVTADGGNMIAIQGSELSRSTGDEPGTAGGVTSSTNMKEATWLSYSFDVTFEGKGACRLTDKLMMNHANTVCLAGFLQTFLRGPKGPTECAELLKRIMDVVGENVSGKVNGIRGLWERFSQQNTGQGAPTAPLDRGPNPEIKLHPNGTNAWMRHDHEIAEQQKQLQDLIDAYDKHCGGGGGPPVPQNARDWAKKQRPQPNEWTGPAPAPVPTPVTPPPAPATPRVETSEEGINWGKVGWGLLAVGAGVAAVALVVCPFDGPVGEVALGTAAVAAWAKASSDDSQTPSSQGPEA